MIRRVPDPVDQARSLGSIHELNGRMMAKKQIVRHLADRGARRIAVTTNAEEKLVLGGGEPDRRGLAVTPVQKPPQPGPELEKSPIIVVGETPDSRGSPHNHETSYHDLV